MKSLLILCFALVGYAYAQNPGREAFARLSVEERASFLLNQAEEIELAGLRPHLVNHPVLTAVKAQALRATNVWWDTILEGDYELTGQPEIADVTVFLAHGQVYGYRVTARADAIATGACDYDEENETWGEDCQPGAIVEGFLFDFRGRLLEGHGDYADFHD